MDETRSEAATQRKHQQQLELCMEKNNKERWSSFQMPLHYPNYTESEYEAMPEQQLDCLLHQYGLPISGDIHNKRKFAVGAFLWSHCRPN